MRQIRHEPTQPDDGRDSTLIQRPRRYEFGAAVNFLGRRRTVYDSLVALSGARPGDRVLDVGCGTGYLTRRVAPAVAPDGYALGIDPSPSVVAYAARRAPANCTFEIGRAQALPYADGSFDLVVSSLAMHHVPRDDRPGALREMCRVLRPGGRLFVVDYDGQPRHLHVANLIGLLSRHTRQHSHAGDLTALIAQAGFRVTGAGVRWPSLRYVQAELSEPT